MKVAELIPQFFYDLIARLLPGGILLVGLNFAVQADVFAVLLTPFAHIRPLSESFLFLFALTISAAYLVGHLLGPLSRILQHKIVPSIRPLSGSFHVLRSAIMDDNGAYAFDLQSFLAKELGYASLAAARQAKEVRYTPAVYIWADWLRLLEPGVGARLVKLRAEYRMHAQLAVALILVLLTHWGAVITGATQPSWLLSGIGAAVVVLSIRNVASSFRNFQWSVLNHLYAEKAIGGTRGLRGSNA